MKPIVAILAAFSRKVPWLLVALSLVLTAALGSLAGQVEVASGNEGFAPESPEIAAQESFNPGACYVSPLCFEPRFGRVAQGAVAAEVKGAGRVISLFFGQPVMKKGVTEFVRFRPLL